MPKFLDAIAGFGVTFGTMFKKRLTEEYPEKPGPVAKRYHGRHQLNRYRRRAGEVHRLRAVRLGLPGRRHLRRGRGQHRGRTVLARRTLRPRLPDQLSAVHRLRVVHRGLPHPGADDDQRIRDGRRQPRRPDLRQGQTARAAAAGHGAAAPRHGAGQHRRGLLPRQHQADRTEDSPGDVRVPRGSRRRHRRTHLDGGGGAVLGARHRRGARRDRRGRRAEGGLLGDVPGHHDDRAGGVLHRPGRAVPRRRAGGRLHRRGDDAVPVRADADRRRLLRIAGGNHSRTTRRGDRGRRRFRDPAHRRHRQRVGGRIHRPGAGQRRRQRRRGWRR